MSRPLRSISARGVEPIVGEPTRRLVGRRGGMALQRGAERVPPHDPARRRQPAADGDGAGAPDGLAEGVGIGGGGKITRSSA
jgi:hypothetical protein